MPFGLFEGEPIIFIEPQKLFINGEFCQSSSACIVAGETVGMRTAYIASKQDVHNCVDSSLVAAKSWGRLNSKSRVRDLLTFSDSLRLQQPRSFYSWANCHFMPNPLVESQLANAVQHTVYFAGCCDKLDKLQSSHGAINHQQAEFVPLGVVVLVCEGLLDFSRLVDAIVSCLAAGNSIIVCGDYQVAKFIAPLAFSIFNSSLENKLLSIMTCDLNEVISIVLSKGAVGGVCVVKLGEKLSQRLYSEMSPHSKKIWTLRDELSPGSVFDACDSEFGQSV